jgi:5-methylcytosine-specific restriction endonuclease McrA
MTKTCSRCNTEKDLEDFYRQTNGKHGRYAHCKACHLALTNAARARDQQANPEKWAALNKRKWQATDRAKKRESDRRWREANRERLKEGIRAAKAKKPDHYRKLSRDAAARRRRVNPAQFRLYDAQRRARVLGAPISDFTLEEWRDRKREFGGRCAYCGIVPRILSMDHVIPLARGGNHTRANIVPSCVPCNKKKNAGEAPPFHADFSDLAV